MCLLFLRLAHRAQNFGHRAAIDPRDVLMGNRLDCREEQIGRLILRDQAHRAEANDLSSGCRIQRHRDDDWTRLRCRGQKAAKIAQWRSIRIGEIDQNDFRGGRQRLDRIRTAGSFADDFEAAA